MAISKVCVIGAGTMGAGIAAQVANSGVPVLLLDIVPEGADDRDAVAKRAVANMLKASPAPFMSPGAAKLVETGNIDDDLERVAECDWIVEAVIERLDVKQSLFARIEQLKKPGTAVSSNTSTIPLANLLEGRSDAFRRDFLITHFFNPPRYMQLIEVVTGPQTDSAVAERVSEFVDRSMGKHIVRCKDTPAFIANRIGTYWLTVAINAALDLGLTVEEADQIGGPPMGVPKTGIFGLIDLVGIDLMPLLSKSLTSTLPEGDAYFSALRPLPLVDRMIAEGFTGRKGKGGFYRLEKGAGGKRSKLAMDLQTGEYRAESKPAALPPGVEKDVAALIDSPGKVGAFAWAVLGPVLAYAASLAGEIADDVVAIDEAMKLGYNWKYGPFELIDRLGPGKLAERRSAEGQAVPQILQTAGDRPFYRVLDGRREYLTFAGDYAPVPRPEGVILLDDVKLRSKPLLSNSSAALWDIGDGVTVFEFTTKMNIFDEQTMALIHEAVELVGANYRALIIYNEGKNFSAGANLANALFTINIAAWGEMERTSALGQQAFKALKYAPFPVVVAPAGLALGGGCEITLHADAVQAAAETYIGLVEVGVGIVPGWGGCGEMLDRIAKAPGAARGPMPAVVRAFEMISTARVSKSAADAADMTILREGDGITMNRDRLLADAKAKALSLVEDYVPPEPPSFSLPGPSGRTMLAAAIGDFRKRGLATDYDEVIGLRLAEVLTGGDADPTAPVSEADMLFLERKALVECTRDPRTQARMEHMLSTGKPLRN